MSAQTIAIGQHFKNDDIQQMSVTNAAAQFPAVSTTAGFKGRCENIFIQALATNTQTITIGKTGVTAGGAGIELVAGANINLPINDPTVWYAIAVSGTQKLNIHYQSGTN